LPSVYGHEAHFLQLMQNLIANAIKYRGEQTPQIVVSAERRDSEWLFAVADNGMGIPPEYQRQIFGLFKRLHGKTIPGTGIGLAICQRVVERYGGKIWVQSEENRGAKFYFTLPVAASKRQ
jgi:signal transduction histidine kinase